jgi:hypothetical protein
MRTSRSFLFGVFQLDPTTTQKTMPWQAFTVPGFHAWNGQGGLGSGSPAQRKRAPEV